MAKAIVTIVGKSFDQPTAKLDLDILVLYDDGVLPLRAETARQSFGSIPQNITDAIALNRLRQFAATVVLEAWGAVLTQNDIVVLP
jgi:hypothetical protein